MAAGFALTDALSLLEGFHSIRDCAEKEVAINVNKRAATWRTNPNSKIYGDSDPVPLTTGSGENFLLSDGAPRRPPAAH